MKFMPTKKAFFKKNEWNQLYVAPLGFSVPLIEQFVPKMIRNEDKSSLDKSYLSIPEKFRGYMLVQFLVWMTH